MYVYAPVLKATATIVLMVWLLAGYKKKFDCCGTVHILGYQIWGKNVHNLMNI